MFGIFKRWQRPNAEILRPVAPDRKDHATQASEQFARDLLDWLERRHMAPIVDWNALVRASFVFAEETQRPVISPMSLAKALARLGIRKRWRYLPVNDHRYRQKRDLGQRRPRRLVIELPNVRRETDRADANHLTRR